MRFPRPNSMNSLVLTGFALVSLPLVFAIIWALDQINGFASASEALLDEGTTIASQSRQLEKEITEFERHARQYQILENEETLTYIRTDVQDIKTLLSSLSSTVADSRVAQLVETLTTDVETVALAVATVAPASPEFTKSIEVFGKIQDTSVELSNAISNYIESASRKLREDADNAQRTLTWQSIAIVPVTIGVVLIFTLLIGRPIRQLDRAISQLGEGGFSKPIEVQGPSDLNELGKQLEWLRIRLLQLAQEKNRFLRHMSHELKTPLANIREGTDLLLDGTVGNLEGPQHEVTTILQSNSLKLQRLIENLLSFSAWQTKSETLALKDFDVMGLIRTVVSDHRLQLKTQQIKLHAGIEKISINADREMLKTALDNLLSNAVKFTPRNGDIYIKARLGKNRFILEVADTGPGIPESEQAQIFEPFFQGGTEQKGPVAGTGIGLSVVAECAEAHGGTVELVNGEYPGAHFRMHIPQEKLELQQRMVANA